MSPTKSSDYLVSEMARRCVAGRAAFDHGVAGCSHSTCSHARSGEGQIPGTRVPGTTGPGGPRWGRGGTCVHWLAALVRAGCAPVRLTCGGPGQELTTERTLAPERVLDDRRRRRSGSEFF